MVEAEAAAHADPVGETLTRVRPPNRVSDLLSHPTVSLSSTSTIAAAVRRGTGLEHAAQECREVDEVSFRELQPGDVVVLDIGVRFLMLIKAKSKRWIESYCYVEGDSGNVETVLISTGGTCTAGRTVSLFTNGERIETNPVKRVFTSGPH